MPFFSDISKKVGDAAKTAAKKSGDLVETTKLNMAINSEEDKIKNVYAEIGKVVYSKFIKDESVDPELIGNCQQIKAMEDNIVSIREKIAQLKSMKLCSGCKQEIELATVFCPKCGAKQEMPEPQAAPQYASVPVSESAEPQIPPQYSPIPGMIDSQPQYGNVQNIGEQQYQTIPQYIPNTMPTMEQPKVQEIPVITQEPQAIPVSSEKICSACGVPVLDTAKFCPSCGNKL